MEEGKRIVRERNENAFVDEVRIETKYDPKRWRVYTSKHWMILHWLINPAMAFNELVLGQRVPKVSLLDLESKTSRFESTVVPCPHCNSMHDGRTWSTQQGTAFWNWYGLFCPNCHNVIPCVRNLLAALLLGLSYPFWIWSNERSRERWMNRQPKRFQSLNFGALSNPYSGRGWIKIGLSYGLFMYLYMTFLSPLLFSEPITLSSALIGVPIWILAGLGFGFFMKKAMG